MAEKLTDREEVTDIANDDLIHVVDIGDTTDSPEGTSKKATKGNILKGLPKTVSGYEGYLILPGALNTNRAIVQSGDILIGKGDYFNNEFVIMVAKTDTPSDDSTDGIDFEIRINLSL